MSSRISSACNWVETVPHLMVYCFYGLSWFINVYHVSSSYFPCNMAIFAVYPIKPSLVEFTVPRGCNLFQASPKRTLWLWLRGNSSGRSSHWVQQPVISYDLGTTKIVINYSINWIAPPLFINWNKLGGLLDPCWILICMSSPVSKHTKMIQCVATDQKNKKGSGF